MSSLEKRKQEGKIHAFTWKSLALSIISVTLTYPKFVIMSRRKGASSKQNEPKRFTRESKAPGANAELLSSIQVSYESIEAYVCVYVCSYKPMLLYLIA